MGNCKRSIVLLAFIFAAAAFAGCSGTDEPATCRVTIDICNDGELFLNGDSVSLGELKAAMTAKAQELPKETVNRMEVSPVEVLIKTEHDVRYEAICDVLETCSALYIYRMYYTNPDANSGREIKLWLSVNLHYFPRIDADRMVEKPIINLDDEQQPQNAQQGTDVQEESDKGETGQEPAENTSKKPVICRSRERIKLLWVDSKNHSKRLSAAEDPKGTSGTVALKIGFRMLMNENAPDWALLEKSLTRMVENYKPTERFKSPPITIAPMPKVRFADVLKCAVICRRAGINIISLAAREVPY